MDDSWIKSIIRLGVLVSYLSHTTFGGTLYDCRHALIKNVWDTVAGSTDKKSSFIDSINVRYLYHILENSGRAKRLLRMQQMKGHSIQQ